MKNGLTKDNIIQDLLVSLFIEINPHGVIKICYLVFCVIITITFH